MSPDKCYSFSLLYKLKIKFFKNTDKHWVATIGCAVENQNVLSITSVAGIIKPYSTRRKYI